MTRLSATEARQEFSEAINRVAYGGERVIVHRRGKDVAALVSIEDLRFLEELEDRMDVEAARAAMAEEGESVPWEQVKAELGL